MKKSRSMCAGCRDDFYNHTDRGGYYVHSPSGCWNFEDARVVRRWKLGWWSAPVESGAFTEVEVLDCYNQPGQYAYQETLPSFAEKPIRLSKAVAS